MKIAISRISRWQVMSFATAVFHAVAAWRQRQAATHGCRQSAMRCGIGIGNKTEVARSEAGKKTGDRSRLIKKLLSQSGQRCPAQGTIGFLRVTKRKTFAVSRKGITYTAFIGQPAPG
jgi:hypothetical protein